MHLRASMTTADPSRVDDLVGYVRDQVLPTIHGEPGCRALAMAADADSGRCSLVTFWQDLDAVRSSADRADALRNSAAERFGLAFDVTVAEVVEWHVREEPRPGCWNRVTMFDIAPAELDGAVELFRSSTLPALDVLDGFCAAVMSVDREQGRAVAVTTWRDRDALRASTERANALREEVRDKAHGQITAVTEMEIVLTDVTP